jgi:TonB-linked SusC/RagA family outer membrane protein
MRKLLFLFLLLFGTIAMVSAQGNRTITGKITDANGKPVPGATIQVKGTKLGVSATEEGVFSISVPTSATTLTISGVGFFSQDLRIGSNTVLNVSLATDNKNLDEVVVIAYGTAKKETLTGSVGTIKAADIAKRPLTNVTTALEGAIPGVITGSANGQPGSGNTIRIRGFGSINASSDPLFVVDGVPYVGGLSNINPDDVESTTVLKDASATALFGSRGANGVVMITTKKGKKGRNNISLRLLQGYTSRGLEEYSRVNAFQYYPLMWEAYRNQLLYPATGAGISLDSANRVASGLTTRTGIQNLLSYNPFNVPNNTIVGTNGLLNPIAQLIYPDDLDWTKELIKSGNRKDYSVNFSGGNDKSDYFLSLGYLDDKGYTLRSDLQRYSARLNVNINPLPWLKTGLNVSGNFSSSNTASDGGSTSFVNPFFYSRNIGPIYPVYAHNMTTGAFLLDGTGNRFWDLGNMGGSQGVPNRPSGGFAGRHALAETSLNEQNFNRSVVSARSYVDITFLKNFKFTNNISVDFQGQYESSYENTLVGDGAPAGRSSRDYGSNMGVILSQLLNYGKKLGDHRVDVLVGHESFNQRQEALGGFKQGQSLSGNTELGNFTTINSSTSSLDRYTIESFLSRVNYDYKGKYYVSGSIRRDGNSRFAEQSRWGTFWSVGGGWNIDRENFMKNVTWVNLLKLRSSYGLVGVADGIGFYAYQGLYNFANNANEPGIVQSQSAFLNRELTWETQKQFDIGLEFSLFKNRLNGSVEYYERVSSDLLFAVPQPLSSGALTVNQNTATMYNKGIEIQLTGDVLKRKDFIWNMGVNLSTVINRVTKMPATVPEFVTGTKKYAVNQSIFDYWLRTYYGVDPTDGAALYVAQNTAASPTRRLITNKLGGVDTVTTSISNGKFEYQGSTIPDFYGSFTQSITFKELTISALFTFQVGGLTYDANYAGLMSSGTYGGAIHTDILNRWQKPGDITNVPRLDAGRTTDFNGGSSRWLIDASYFNIRTINVSHSLPKSLTNKMKVNNGQFFVSIENVMFSSKRVGLNNQQAFSGVTSNAYPPARIFTAGITLNL